MVTEKLNKIDAYKTLTCFLEVTNALIFFFCAKINKVHIFPLQLQTTYFTSALPTLRYFLCLWLARQGKM